MEALTLFYEVVAYPRGCIAAVGLASGGLLRIRVQQSRLDPRAHLLNDCRAAKHAESRALSQRVIVGPAKQKTCRVRIAGTRRIDYVLYRRCFLNDLLIAMHDDRSFFGTCHSEQIVVVLYRIERFIEAAGSHQFVYFVLIGNNDLHAVSYGVFE